MANIRQGVTEDMILKAFAINMKRCAIEGSRYIKYTFRDLMGESGGTAGIECLDEDLKPLADPRSKVDLRACFDPLEKCAEQQRLFDLKEGRTSWNLLSVILDLETGKFTRKTEMISETAH